MRLAFVVCVMCSLSASAIAQAQFPVGLPPGFPGAVPGQGQQGNPQAGLTTSRVNATADARTNTVVITGDSESLKQIERIIKEIDANPTPDSETYVYRLRNGSALNIEAVANLLFTGTGGNNRGTNSTQQLNQNRTGATQLGSGGGRGAGGGETGLGTGFTGGGGLATTAGGGRIGGVGGVNTVGGVSTSTAGAAAGLVGQVNVVADPNTNSLLITTNSKNWVKVKAILDELDRSVPQVLIKVLIAEVSHQNATDLGADLSFFNLRLNPAGSLTEGQSFTTLFGRPLTGGVISFTESNFSATIHALQTLGKIDVLSRPYILASDNQLATITVGQTVPYVSNSQTTAQGNTINTVQYSNVGVLLDVIPHINPDGMVILDIAPEISSLTDSTVQVSEAVQAPVFNTRSAQSRVAVQNGQTVVIGGLMQDRVNSTISKIPILGDIPWVGEAFKRRVESKTKTELLIFMTPHVASRPDQLQAMGQDEMTTTKLIPNAVAPGTFQEHLTGMEAAKAPPTTYPDRVGGIRSGTVAPASQPQE